MPETIREIQEQYCSSYDKRKYCSYDIEFIDSPTKPLIHQKSRFWLITEGEGDILVNDRRYHVQKNSFFCILPWESSYIEKVKKPLHLIKVIFNSDMISTSLRTGYNVSNEALKILDPIMQTPVLQLTEEETEKVMNILDIIKAEVGIDSIYDTPEEKELSALLVTNKLMELLIAFNRYALKKECLTNNGSSIELDRRPAIFKYMYSHLADHLTIARLAEVFDMDEGAVSKYLTDVTGLRFQALTNEMRITKTTDLLTYTNLALTDIAFLVGFSDASHLVRTFSARMGTLPNRYRQVYQAKDYVFKEKDHSLGFSIIGYIHQHFMEDIHASNVAEHFHTSVVEMNKNLLYILEKNFDEFLHYLRINRACELLLETDAALVDIGISVGYNTVKTFTRNFIRMKGMTPGEFRKKFHLQLEEE